LDGIDKLQKNIMMHRNLKNSWSGELSKALLSREDFVPEEYLTMTQISNLFALRGAQTQRLLALMISQGRVETKKFAILVNKEYSLVRPIVHYRLIKKKPISLPKRNARKVSAVNKSWKCLEHNSM
jgi:hypothetical protein